jgi:hypothetical protein
MFPAEADDVPINRLANTTTRVRVTIGVPCSTLRIENKTKVNAFRIAGNILSLGESG